MKLVGVRRGAAVKCSVSVAGAEWWDDRALGGGSTASHHKIVMWIVLSSLRGREWLNEPTFSPPNSSTANAG